MVFADSDDVGVSKLVRHLGEQLSITWWRFGVSESTVSVEADGGYFRLEQPGATVETATLRAADVILYRRRLLQPRPLVISELPSAHDRNFSEREWGSLIEGLLLAEEDGTRAQWLNSPSSTLLTGHKLPMLLRASRMGLRVPAFSVSTPVRFPAASRDELITKAISSDERIDDARYFTTALLSQEDLRNLPGTRLPTPSLLQEYIRAEIEVRVFYALGGILALALSRPREHVDIRYAQGAELLPRPYVLAPELRAALAELASAFSLGYCTFDLLIPGDGTPLLIDITPNGDWDHFESDGDPVITNFLVDRIAAHSPGARRT